MRVKRRRIAKVTEIASAIAADLGYGDITTLPSDQRLKVEDEASDAIDRWEESVEMEQKPVDPKTPLQKLLREHHDVCEQILDIQDEGL